jgi:hypothetical protein
MDQARVFRKVFSVIQNWAAVTATLAGDRDEEQQRGEQREEDVVRELR